MSKTQYIDLTDKQVPLKNDKDFDPFQEKYATFDESERKGLLIVNSESKPLSKDLFKLLKDESIEMPFTIIEDIPRHSESVHDQSLKDLEEIKANSESISNSQKDLPTQDNEDTEEVKVEETPEIRLDVDQNTERSMKQKPSFCIPKLSIDDTVRKEGSTKSYDSESGSSYSKFINFNHLGLLQKADTGGPNSNSSTPRDRPFEIVTFKIIYPTDFGQNL